METDQDFAELARIVEKQNKTLEAMRQFMADQLDINRDTRERTDRLANAIASVMERLAQG